MKKLALIAASAFLCSSVMLVSACSPSEETGGLPDSGVTDTTPPIPEIPEIPEFPEEELPEEELPEDAMKAQYIYVNYNGLNVRSGAGTTYTSLGTVESDILLKYVGKTGNWYETVFKDRTAYISASEVYTSITTLDKGQEDVENVIEQGLRMMGVPYVYGAVRLHDGKGNFIKGFTIKQFDCSSLMQYIFYEGAGILLNVTSRTQSVQGKEVARTEIRRGDLLFFTNASRYNNSGVDRIGHVALYLGNNYILHTASDYAKVEQISAKRWSYFVSARRMF